MPLLAGQQTLVIASHNAGKVREIGALLAPHGLAVVSAADKGLTAPAETGTTFAQNARLKARFTADATGLPALSDDSGLCVDALGGAPGVYSADWAERDDGSRDFGWAMEKVEAAIAEQRAESEDDQNDRAFFVCMLCLAFPGGDDHLFEGRVHGRLIFPPRGDKGFGYDPIFQPDGETQTFGEIEPARKHAMSHRADAFDKFVTAAFSQA